MKRPGNRSAKRTPTARADRRPSASARGYGSRWRRASRAFLTRHPLCVHCAETGTTTAAECVDHVVPVTGPDDPMFFVETNWQSLCIPCHSIKTQREDRHRGRAAQCRAVIVCGAPGSGKTTYVEQHRGPDDIVFDLDRLAAAINPRWSHYDDRPDDVARLLLDWRQQLLDRIARRRLHRRAWIIISDADRAADAADLLDARLVSLPS